MQTQTNCPNCNQKLRVGTEKLGKLVGCPKCQQSFSIDSSGSASLESIEKAAIRTSEASADSTLGSISKNPTQARSTRAPRKLGRFEVVSVLGAGGFGRVYKAKDPSLDRFVALKVPMNVSDGDNRISRFLVEAKAAARLRHPNIVTTYESGKAGNQFYIATEYIKGELLSERLERGSLSFSEAAEIVRKLAVALQYAHKRGIIHRDLKPHNVMLDGDGEPQLMDFGLAKRTDDDSNMTTDGSLLGTPAYMSPEQARGEVSKVDALSDQYSLGVILYYLLTGSTPHSGAPYVIVSKVAMGEYHPVREKNSEVDPTLEAICQKAMMPERGQRYQSCKEFADDLQAWSEASPVLARPMTRLQNRIHHAQRHKVAVGAVSAVTAVIFAGMLLAMLVGQSQPGSVAGDSDVAPQVATDTAAGGGNQATEGTKLPGEDSVAVPTRPEFIFADFENGTYGDWTHEGIAFGNTPRSSFSPATRDDRFALHPWPINGKFIADSFYASNGAGSGKFTGKLTSPTFTIHQRFINFMGAGRVEYVRLIVDGDVVLTGERDADTPFDRLAPIMMDVNDYLGQTATLEILDDGTGRRDHVTIDHFVFSDSDLRQAWLAKCVEDTKAEAIELLGRKYYFGPIPLTLENAKDLANVVGGRLVTVESDAEATSLRQYLKGPTWTGIKNIHDVWQNSNGDVYTHCDWATDRMYNGIPSSSAIGKHANLTLEAQHRSEGDWLYYPVIEFGEMQKPPGYKLSSPEENRQLAEFLVDSKAAFILATADRFVFHFNRNDSSLPAEPFEVWTVSLGPGLEVDRQVEQLFNFDNKIRHLEIKEGDDDTLKLVPYLSELRSLQVKGGNYGTWDGLSEMSSGHPLTKLELSDVAFNAEQISPLFRGKGLHTVYFQSAKLGPQIGDLIARHRDSLVHYWSNVCPGLGRKGFEALGKCKRLRTAMLWGSDVRDEDLKHLGQIQSLEDVQLGANRSITGATLDQLAGWQKVHNLEFVGNPITDETLANLPELPSLRSIDLTSTKIRGPGLAQLNKLPSLEFVELDKTFVDDAAILHLVDCKKLLRLTATDTGVTREGLTPLSQRFPGFSAHAKAAGSDLVSLTETERVVAAWVRSMGGETFFDKGLQIEIPPSAKISDSDFQRFQDLPNLTSLIVSNGETNFRIAGIPLSDEAILHLKSLPRLRTIVVGGKEITDRSLEHLAQFPIEELTVFKASITNGGLRHFKNHNLRTLALNDCQQVRELDLNRRSLAQVETLHLRGTHVPGSALADLVGTQNLRELSCASGATGETCQFIGNLESLEVLEIVLAKIDDRDLRYLSNLRNLKSLSISRNRLTENGLQFIANNFPLLENLDFGFNEVDASTTIDWTGLQKLESIYLYPTRVSDQQLEAMAKMSNLNKLTFGPIDYATTNLSPEAMQTFANKLPECRIWDATAKEHAERMRNLSSKQPAGRR